MKPKDEDGKSKPSSRGKPSEEKPYCWQSRAALERIREFQDMNHSTATLAIYGTLTEIASRNGSGTFTETQRSIMQLAGIRSDNTLRKHLEDLCEMRLLKIKENHYANGSRAPSTYTLLSVRSVPQSLRVAPQRDCGAKKRTKKETHPSDGHAAPLAQCTHQSAKDGTSAAPTCSVFEKGEEGYLIGNSFFLSGEANRIAAGNVDVLLAAKRAVRYRDGSVKEQK